MVGLGGFVFLGGVSKKDEEEGRLVVWDVGCRSLTADLPPRRWRWRWTSGKELTLEKNQPWRRIKSGEEPTLQKNARKVHMHGISLVHSAISPGLSSPTMISPRTEQSAMAKLCSYSTMCPRAYRNHSHPYIETANPPPSSKDEINKQGKAYSAPRSKLI